MTHGDGAIDLSVLHSWASPLDVFEYLPAGWRNYIAEHMPRQWHDHMLGNAPRPPGRLVSSPMSSDLAYHNPLGDYLPGSMPDDAYAAGSDLELLRQQHLDAAGIRLALLCHGPGMLVPAIPVPRLTAELTRAINDWTVDRWLEADSRLLGTVLVPTQLPDVAAAEIRRVGSHPRMAAVLLAANPLGKPFGHPIYEPIHAAAEETGLSLVISAGGDQTMETSTYPAAGGLPGTFAEFRALAPQALMTHAASLIAQGVLHRWRSISCLLLGGGVTWMTPWLWRFDTDYKAFRQSALWLKSRPSEVFCERFLVGTHPFRLGAAVERLAAYLQVDHDLAGVVCYASGYPDRDYYSPEVVAAALPQEWESKVLRENALRFLHQVPEDVTANAAAQPAA
jgi:predicted TIM-barrel fold metal-dependent hydrolase